MGPTGTATSVVTRLGRAGSGGGRSTGTTAGRGRLGLERTASTGTVGVGSGGEAARLGVWGRGPQGTRRRSGLTLSVSTPHPIAGAPGPARAATTPADRPRELVMRAEVPLAMERRRPGGRRGTGLA